MRLAIDGVAFQLGQASRIGFWASVLPCLAEHAELDVLMLDRGGSPQLPRVKSIPFPSYAINNAAADSLLIETVCEEEKVDVFISTLHTTPLTIPSILILHAAGLEARAGIFSERAAQEREVAMSHAAFFVCDSEQAKTAFTSGWSSDAKRRAVVIAWQAGETPLGSAADRLCELLVRAREESDNPATKSFHEEWRRLRAIQAETDIGERVEISSRTGSLQFAATMCTLAKLFRPLGRLSPVLQRRLSRLEDAGVLMWNQNQPPRIFEGS